MTTDENTEAYDFQLLASGGQPSLEFAGLIQGLDESQHKRAVCEQLRLGCDTRIPSDCNGYVADACSEHATRAKRTDSLKMLAKHVPFFVPLYRSSPVTDLPARAASKEKEKTDDHDLRGYAQQRNANDRT